MLCLFLTVVYARHFNTSFRHIIGITSKFSTGTFTDSSMIIWNAYCAYLFVKIIMFKQYITFWIELWNYVLFTWTTLNGITYWNTSSLSILWQADFILVTLGIRLAVVTCNLNTSDSVFRISRKAWQAAAESGYATFTKKLLVIVNKKFTSKEKLHKTYYGQRQHIQHLENNW